MQMHATSYQEPSHSGNHFAHISKRTRTIKILGYHNVSFLWGTLKHDPSFENCPNLDSWMKCTFTQSRAELNSSDAVLFKGGSVTRENQMPPNYRLPNQKWIFYESESPAWNKPNLVDYKDIFNITSTYSRDSDIPFRFMNFGVLSPEKLHNLEMTNRTYHQDKKGYVAWFVSHCKTFSQREEYVKELQKYIQVDIFGRCGPLKCGTNLDRGNCDHTLLNANGSYKFYLSFENSICEDYVTEKLWRMWKYEVLQVVMGGVNYTEILPEKTYLNVLDFSSPKELARYLKHLDENDDEYNTYLRRKLSTDSIQLEDPLSYHCRLCHYLHEHASEEQIVTDAALFWSYATKCHEPREYFKNCSDGVVYRIP